MYLIRSIDNSVTSENLTCKLNMKSNSKYIVSNMQQDDEINFKYIFITGNVIKKEILKFLQFQKIDSFVWSFQFKLCN